jgi:hypothetical protein
VLLYNICTDVLTDAVRLGSISNLLHWPAAFKPTRTALTSSAVSATPAGEHGLAVASAIVRRWGLRRKEKAIVCCYVVVILLPSVCFAHLRSVNPTRMIIATSQLLAAVRSTLSGSDRWVVKHDTFHSRTGHTNLLLSDLNPLLCHSIPPPVYLSHSQIFLIGFASSKSNPHHSAPSMATLTMQPIGPTPAPAAQEDQRRVLFLLPFARLVPKLGFVWVLRFIISGAPGLYAGRGRILLPWMVPIWVTSSRGNCYLPPSMSVYFNSRTFYYLAFLDKTAS